MIIQVHVRSLRFSIPQKLSKRTASLPWSQRICISRPSRPPSNRTLKPNSGSSLSLSGAEASFLRAALDHTFRIANPTPADMAGWYCQRMFRLEMIDWSFSPQVCNCSRGIVKEYSEGNGSMCLGTEEDPRAVACSRCIRIRNNILIVY